MKQRRFKHQSVSNLAWALGSTPLMLSHPRSPYQTLNEKWFNINYQLHEEWLWKLDAKPQPLNNFLAVDKRIPLGKQFEKLIQFWIENSPHFKLIAHNVQLKDGKDTVGEIDFLFEELASGDVFHMEVACKFYLGYKNSSAWDHWIGPNGTDNLDLKMNKLDQQLAITSTPAGSSYLSELNRSKPKPVLLLKGMFFHYYRDLLNHKAPKFSSPNYLAGWWVRLNDLDHFFASEGNWMVLPKSDWLSPYETHFGEHEVYESYQMKAICTDLVQQYNRSLAVVQLFPSEVGFSEGSRGFVVPNHWPSRH